MLGRGPPSLRLAGRRNKRQSLGNPQQVNNEWHIIANKARECTRKGSMTLTLTSAPRRTCPAANISERSPRPRTATGAPAERHGRIFSHLLRLTLREYFECETVGEMAWAGSTPALVPCCGILLHARARLKQAVSRLARWWGAMAASLCVLGRLCSLAAGRLLGVVGVLLPNLLRVRCFRCLLPCSWNL